MIGPSATRIAYDETCPVRATPLRRREAGGLLPESRGSDKARVVVAAVNMDLATTLERDDEKWKPIFQRNPVYADCASLSAIPLYTFGIDHVHEFGPIPSELIVI
jgi:hypothetical protein